ncbi:histidinol dehydrogenase domain protein, partial [Helicobacter pylori R32b]
IFLNQARDSANNQITANKTESLEAITQAKTNANNEITANQTASLEAITLAKTTANNEITANQTQAINTINEAKEQPKEQAKNEIIEAKKTAFNELLETLKPKFSGLFADVYYIHNTIYINGGWEQKVKDLSDYTLEKSKKGE